MEGRITASLSTGITNYHYLKSSTYLNSMDQWSKQEHKELHRSHGILKEPPPVILFLIIRDAVSGVSWRSLVFNLMNKGATTPSPTGASVSSKSVIAAVLRSLQQHPVESVKQLSLRYSKLILMSWIKHIQYCMCSVAIYAFPLCLWKSYSHIKSVKLYKCYYVLDKYTWFTVFISTAIWLLWVQACDMFTPE